MRGRPPPFSTFLGVGHAALGVRCCNIRRVPMAPDVTTMRVAHDVSLTDSVRATNGTGMARRNARVTGRRRHLVLIVDDYDDTREALVDMMTVKGFEAVGAPSGTVALDLFRAGMRPCVVLLDIYMPEMSGWEVAERMHADAELNQIPIVILSSAVEDRMRMNASGVRDFLRKPAEARELQLSVERHCERHSLRPPGVVEH